jgi:hypothetical protein
LHNNCVLSPPLITAHCHCILRCIGSLHLITLHLILHFNAACPHCISSDHPNSALISAHACCTFHWILLLDPIALQMLHNTIAGTLQCNIVALHSHNSITYTSSFSRLLCHTTKAAPIHYCSSTLVPPRCSATLLLHTITSYVTFIAVPGKFIVGAQGHPAAT